MNKVQAIQMIAKYQYLVGRVVDYLPTAPTIKQLDYITDSEVYIIVLRCENPHPSIGKSYTEHLMNYCKNEGIEYSLPSDL